MNGEEVWTRKLSVVAGCRQHLHHTPIVEGAAHPACIVASTEGRWGKPDMAEPRKSTMIKANKAEDAMC